MGERVLVTGGAGFIGSNVADALLARGDRVRILDNFATGRRENVAQFLDEVDLKPGGFELVEGDLRDFHTVARAVRGCDAIAHIGALPSVPRSVEEPLTTNNVNITGTLNVLEAARDFGVRRIVLASSSSVYGANKELPKREDMAPRPLSPYAISKLTCERYFQVYHELYGMETVVLRYFNVFGVRQDPNSTYAAVIPKFIRAMRAGKRPTIFGDGEQSRDFTYVSNVVDANLLALGAPPGSAGEVFNTACGESFTLNELVATLNRVLGTDLAPVYDGSRLGDVKHSQADISKARSILGYEPHVSFEDGLKKTVEALP